MSIFNYLWRHNNVRTKLRTHTLKLREVPFRTWTLHLIGLFFLYQQFIALTMDIVPNLEIMEKDVRN